MTYNKNDEERNPVMDRMIGIRNSMVQGKLVSNEDYKHAFDTYMNKGEPTLGLDILKSGQVSEKEKIRIFERYNGNTVKRLDANIENYKKSKRDDAQERIEDANSLMEQAKRDYIEALKLGKTRAEERQYQDASKKEETKTTNGSNKNDTKSLLDRLFRKN